MTQMGAERDAHPIGELWPLRERFRIRVFRGICGSYPRFQAQRCRQPIREAAIASQMVRSAQVVGSRWGQREPHSVNHPLNFFAPAVPLN